MANSGVMVLDQAKGDAWALYHSDCIEMMRGLPANSVHYKAVANLRVAEHAAHGGSLFSKLDAADD